MPRRYLQPEMIVFAVPDYEPAVGGTTRQVGLQARALALRGYHVSVVTRRLESSWPKHEVVDGISIHRVGPRGHGTLAEKRAVVAVALWILRRRRAVTVFQPVMWADCVFGAAVCGILSQTAVIWAIRGDAEIAVHPGSSPVRRLQGHARRILLRRCCHVVLTTSMAQELTRAGLETDVSVIPVPVARTYFRPPTPAERAEARTILCLDDDEFTIVFVGHLERRKGVDRLVEAFAALAPALPMPARLLIVGGPRSGADNTTQEIRLAVHRGGLTDTVMFLGSVQSPREALWAADAFVLPSFREGLPNSILEAMSCGVPCIAPSSAGGDEVITPCTGIVPRSNVPADLCAALMVLAADPARRLAMGAAAVEQSRTYDIERVIGEYERLYERMSSSGR